MGIYKSGHKWTIRGGIGEDKAKYILSQMPAAIPQLGNLWAQVRSR